MTWSPSAPYNDLPPLPPVAILETHRVLKHTIEARAALSAVNTSIASLSNPYVLINSISLLEAQASSEIENIVTTTDDLFSFAENMGESGDPEVREALRYRLALFDGIEHLTTRPITTNLAQAMCIRIKGHDMEIRSLPGTFIGNPATGEAVYTPPVGFVVIQEKLDRWEEFVNNPGTLDPLVAMAVSHYQFEAIHPFADGNGRTGRILNVLS
ncbi:MAG: Fic family protein, partial [Actinomycetales bacterium]|nr:Fic family protein [Actinomycetales bacterium]